MFVQHYRQEVLELALVAYQIGLQDLTVEELNRGCEQSLKECEFFPKVSDIRERGRNVRSRDREIELKWKAVDVFEKTRNWVRINYSPDVPKSSMCETLPPTAEYALKVAGGARLMLDKEQEYWVQKNFVEAYVEIHKKLREQGITTPDGARRFLGSLGESKIDLKQLAAGRDE